MSWTRALGRYEVGKKDGARADVDWLLEHHPPGVDMERVRDFRRFLDR